MLVAACMRRLPKSMAKKGPQVNEPSLNASAVPKHTGTAAAVRLKGLARRNHSSKSCRLVGFAIRPILERVGPVCNRSVHGFRSYRHQASGRFASGIFAGCGNVASLLSEQTETCSLKPET